MMSMLGSARETPARAQLWTLLETVEPFCSPLATFPTIPNPLFPAVGGPVVEAVPTGIGYADGELLVTLFRGVPFAPGTSAVVQIDPSTGVQSPFVSGLKTAIGVLGINDGAGESFLVLQNSSGPAPFFAGPGLVLQFDSPGGAPNLLADCLARPAAVWIRRFPILSRRPVAQPWQSLRR
jgi:hypothetical protein